MADSSLLAPERPASAGARPAAARTVRRRQSLPSGRAVVGGFLVAAAALGVFVAWSRVTAGPTARYVVATRDLPVGAHIEASDLATLPMDLPRQVARSAAFRDPARLVGATVVGPIHADELVQAGDVVKGASGVDSLEISFGIDAARAVGGTLGEGETVDVDATFGAGVDTYTVAVVKGARVVRVDTRGGALADGRTVTVTLAVTTRAETLAISHAVAAGELTLVRTTGVDVPANAPDTYRAPAASKPASG